MDITVVIPTHNRYKLLQRALRSVYKQTLQPHEVIVVDDGSQDQTPQITSFFPQVQYLCQKNSGVSFARNKGIQNASCEWIAFLDDDDEWERDKLKIQSAFHVEHPEFLVSYTDEAWFVDEVEKKVPKKYQKPNQNRFIDHVAYCNIAPSSVMVHKSVFKRVGFFDESLRVCEDYDMWLRILREYPFGYIDQKLLKKHAHKGEQLGFGKNLEYYRLCALKKHTGFLDAHEELVRKYEIVINGLKKQGKETTELQSELEKLRD